MKVVINPGGGLDHVAISAAVEKALEASLKGGAMLIANDMKTSVARGPKTGRIYTTRFRRNRTTGRIFPTEQRVPHQASAPGEAPATDTGKLVGSIVADGKGMAVYVEARSLYAVWLEYGTRYMAARPFFMPAIERNRERINELIRASVATAVAQFRLKGKS